MNFLGAYTFRKMLPRLVIAVILIQISWPIFSWIVNVVDDLGTGLGDLLYAPFGGAAALNFGALLANAHIGIGVSGLFGSWLAVLAVGLLALASLGTVLFLAFTAIVTLFVGLAVLIFRKTLILLLLIFSPIALLFWVFPGQGAQRYWKLWWDNFLKVLIMYPLVVAIIASGRIFAHIVGTQSNGELINFLFIMIGYFFPLFVIFKTYKWGGGIMSMVGQQVNNVQTRAVRASEKPIKDWTREKFTDKWANNYNPFRNKPMQILGSAMGGRMAPTRKGYAKMVRRGQQWSGTQHERNAAVLDKWVRSAEKTGITPEMAKRFNKMARDNGYRGPDTWKAGVKGVAAAKEAARALYWDADNKGDDELKKAINDYAIQSRSNLEFRKHGFIVPDKNPETGETEYVPMAFSRAIGDRQVKDDAMYQLMGGMGSDLGFHNHHNGGGSYVGSVYKRAKKRVWDPATRAFVDNPDYDQEFADTFGINPDTEEMDEDIGRDVNPDMFWLARTLKAASEDGYQLLRPGGSSANAVVKDWIAWAQASPDTSPLVAQAGNSDLPAKVIAQRLIEGTRSAGTRQYLDIVNSEDATRDGVNSALRASGYNYFQDKIGRKWHLSVENLWRANEEADQILAQWPATHPGQAAPVPPNPHHSFGTTHVGDPDIHGAPWTPAAGGPDPDPTPPDDDDGHGYRPATQTSPFMDLPEGGRVRTHTPTSRPTRVSEFGETEYGAGRATASEGTLNVRQQAAVSAPPAYDRTKPLFGSTSVIRNPDGTYSSESSGNQMQERFEHLSGQMNSPVTVEHDDGAPTVYHDRVMTPDEAEAAGYRLPTEEELARPTPPIVRVSAPAGAASHPILYQVPTPAPAAGAAPAAAVPTPAPAAASHPLLYQVPTPAPPAAQQAAGATPAPAAAAAPASPPKAPDDDDFGTPYAGGAGMYPVIPEGSGGGSSNAPAPHSPSRGSTTNTTEIHYHQAAPSRAADEAGAPIELKVDHDLLEQSVKRGVKSGLREGLKKAALSQNINIDTTAEPRSRRRRSPRDTFDGPRPEPPEDEGN